MRTSHLLIPAVLGVGAIVLAGCSSTADSGGDAESGGLQVVATTTQVADFATEIAGDSATVTSLLEAGQSAHSFDPSAADLQALANADVLVINGAGLEEWLDDVIDSSGFDGVTIDASKNVELHETAEGDEHEHEDGDEDGDESEEEHDHEGTDPHIWSDPANAIAMAQTIGDGLAAADDDAADAITSNTDAYIAKLKELQTWASDSIDQVPAADRLLVTNHDTFSYLAAADGITIVGSVMPSFDDNAEVSAQQIDDLVAEIKETGVKAVFSESSINPELAETIADEAGVKVYSGDDSLYADSLGVADSDGATYISSQIHNITLIVESWGAEPLSVPSDLE